MLKFGIVTNINPLTAQVRVQFAEDDILSPWLPVLQQKTLKDKFFAIPDVGEQVACCLDDNAEDGVVLGAIYSNVDSCPAVSQKQLLIKFEDGSFIEYSKETEELTLVFKKINIIADILNTGLLQNTDGIVSEADVSDKLSSMQAMRDIYNPHEHTGNQGQPTSAPDKEMS